MIMINTHQKKNGCDNQKTKCFKSTFGFIGKMKCFKMTVCLSLFLFVGIALLVIWNLKPGANISRHTGSKDGNYENGNGIEDTLKDDSSNLDMPRKMLGLIDWTELSGPDLTYRINEMVRIKTSVQKELHALEAQRTEMQKQVRICRSRYSKLD